MLPDISGEILANFIIPQHKYELHAVTHGLINKSYIVSEVNSGEKAYFLQQIDHHVFADVEGIMHNIDIVVRHFKDLADVPKHLITQQTKSEDNYYKSATGEYWRLYDFVEGITYPIAENEQIAAEAGKMFGGFLSALGGINPSSMIITIPQFHDIEFRYSQFKESLVDASPDRKAKASNLIDTVNANIDYVIDIYREIVESCPTRVTHNDTKLSNLLFDEQQKGICVVDYDTLMPGSWPLDYGDAVRTICSTTVEDDQDLVNTAINLDLCAAFTRNFLGKLATSMTTKEIALLAKTAPYMSFLMGLRMLTDYLNNDVYYATQHEQHNFDRASNQFTLFKNGVSQQEKLHSIVAKAMIK
jgi:phosphotransferase family enzyme